MKEWKDEYHSTFKKLQLQLRDSWEPRTSASQLGKGDEKAKPSSSTSPPAGKGTSQGTRRGPNIALVIARKHSRFCCHLQRVAGSKNIAEIIVFTGRFDVDTLDQVAPGATQPEPQLSDRPWNRLSRKRTQDAKTALREAKAAWRTAEKCDGRSLTERQNPLLEQLRDGSLIRERDAAVKAYGHGTYTGENNEQIQIGGSTGGRTRRVADGYPSPKCRPWKRPRYG